LNIDTICLDAFAMRSTHTASPSRPPRWPPPIRAYADRWTSSS
jgi:hypothetical protein